MQHIDEGTIHSWLDGALSAEEAARVQAHVAECPQCAAAFAEARGFIAASSRILTALDHVPRGVVPAVRPVKWYNRAAWRAAAVVLVVAVGSLVVFRNGGNNPSKSSFVLMETPDTAPIPKPAPPLIISASPQATTTHKPQAPASVDRSTPSAISSVGTLSGKPTAEADFSGKPVRGASPQSNVIPRERARNEGMDAAIGGNAGAAPQVAGAVTAAPQSALSSRVSGVAVMGAVASGQPPLNVVGTPKSIGARVTLYEVAPGDTVTFTEALNVQLNALPPLQVEVVNGVATISWPDPTTGNMLKLSGHMSVERLRGIKLRIERERAAAAAKKGP
jgi:hypothetical protein